ncbi:RNA-directed DNA polymerase, eukaryota [Tanacetum coccineum]
MLVDNSFHACQSLNVILKGKSYSIRVHEERFHAESMIFTPVSKVNTWDSGCNYNFIHNDDVESDNDNDSAFEDEFVGPSLVVENDGGQVGAYHSPSLEDKESSPVLSPIISPRVSQSVCVGTTKEIIDGTENVLFSIDQGGASSSMDHARYRQPNSSNVALSISDSFGPRSSNDNIGHAPDLNIRVDNGIIDAHEDNELNELLSNFQQLSERAVINQPKGARKRNSKHKKKNLVVGEASCSSQASYGGLDSRANNVDEESAMRAIVGEASCSSQASYGGLDSSANNVDEESAMRAIGEQIGVIPCQMIGISVNCNGLGADCKKTWINSLVEKDSPMFLGIQETKLESINHTLVRALWPQQDVMFEYSSAIGASGGILTMWNSRFFSVDQKFAERNYLCILGSWLGISSKVGFVNVYAPQPRSQKALLWNAIEFLISSFDAIWIIFGDFNVVRCRDERSGCHFDSGEANEFNDFISRAGLFDLPLGGRRFTRFDKDGKKVSKLDRFLVSHNFFDSWNDASVSVLCRTFSDHCPILLKVGLPNFGPKPFKIFDKWIGNAGLLEVINNSCGP